MSPSAHRWWRHSVVYQVCPCSFCGSNGDGIGDIPGVTSQHGLRGTPDVCQGDELGRTNDPSAHLVQCQDIDTLNMVRDVMAQRGGNPVAVAPDLMAAVRTKGRDNARTPMPWSAGPQAGTVFHNHRALIALRRSEPALVPGRCDLL